MNAAQLKELIDGWTHEEREQIRSTLASLSIGTIKIDATTNTWAMPMSAMVPAGSSVPVVAHGQVKLDYAKLIILEPQFEKIEVEHITETTEARITKNWFRTRIIEPQITKNQTIEHKHTVTVSRSIWRVRGVFVGCEMQFPAEMAISGDLFGPDGTMTFSGKIIPGIDVSVQIENTTTQEMPFHAVVVGRATR